MTRSAAELKRCFANRRCFKTAASCRFLQWVRSTRCLYLLQKALPFRGIHDVGDKCVAFVEQLVPDFTKQIIAMQFVFYCNAQRVSWIAHLQIRRQCPTLPNTTHRQAVQHCLCVSTSEIRQETHCKLLDFDEVMCKDRNQHQGTATVFVSTPFFALAPMIAVGGAARAKFASTETVSRLRPSWNGKSTISTRYWNTFAH